MHINLSAILRDWIQRHKLIGPGLLLGSGQLSGAVESPSTTLVEKYSLDLAPIFEPGGNALTLEQEVFDLNEDCPGATLQKRFGLILNIGVLEHIFNVPNALT